MNEGAKKEDESRRESQGVGGSEREKEESKRSAARL
jgi:hypothetical protein